MPASYFSSYSGRGSARELLSRVPSCPRWLKIYLENLIYFLLPVSRLREEEIEGAFVVVEKMWHLADDSCSSQILACTRIKTRISPHQKLPKINNKIRQAELSLGNITRPFLRMNLLPRASPPRGHFLSSQTKWQLQPTPLISAYIYRVCYAARSSHVTKVTTNSYFSADCYNSNLWDHWITSR